jgi:hypothetical protein
VAELPELDLHDFLDRRRRREAVAKAAGAAAGCPGLRVVRRERDRSEQEWDGGGRRAAGSLIHLFLPIVYRVRVTVETQRAAKRKDRVRLMTEVVFAGGVQKLNCFHGPKVTAANHVHLTPSTCCRTITSSWLRSGG